MLYIFNNILGVIMDTLLFLSVLSFALYIGYKWSIKREQKYSELHKELDDVIEKLQPKILITSSDVIEGKLLKHISLVSEISDFFVGGENDIAKKEVMAKVLLKAWEMKADAVIGLKTTSIVEGGVVNGTGSVGSRLSYTGTLVQFENKPV